MQLSLGGTNTSLEGARKWTHKGAGLGWLRNSIFKFLRNTKFGQNYFESCKISRNKNHRFSVFTKLFRKIPCKISRNFCENLKFVQQKLANLACRCSFHSKMILIVFGRKQLQIPLFGSIRNRVSPNFASKRNWSET